jgi:mevalonate kinase
LSRGTGRGKVILFGEHAVVYGHPALAAALAQSTTVHATPADRLSFTLPAWGLPEVVPPVFAAVRAIAAHLGVSADVALTGDSTVPARAGLGSSASLCVAIARALAPEGDVEAAANAGEAAFHGNPSGVDVALAARGGIGLFRRGVGLEPVASPRFALVVGLSGEPRDTAARVADVAARRAHPGTDARLAALGALALEATRHFDDLGPLFREAQAHLTALGLASPGIDRLIALALEAGATGAKLTGAGGGGAVIAVGPDPEPVLTTWSRAGFHAFVTEIGA